jgi:RND superfamily putative drug exporter
MTLLGRWNWWAPGWLSQLHERVGLREARLDGPAVAPARPQPTEPGGAPAGTTAEAKPEPALS